MRHRNEQFTRPCGARAFTLVELLTVIAIISLLVGILMPSFGAALRSASAARTMARLTQFANGATQFKSNTGFYPGQRNAVQLAGSDPSGLYTGSQVLAMAMFDFVFDPADPNDPNNQPKSSYINYKSEMFVSGSALPFTLSDGSNDAMAILYFPARLGYDGSDQGAVTDIYRYGDNSVYVETIEARANFKEATGFSGDAAVEMEARFYGANYALDARYSGVRNSDSFLLIAPGTDSAYFTNKTLKNW